MTNELIQHIAVEESTSIQWVKNRGLWKGFVLQESKQEVTKIVSLQKHSRQTHPHTLKAVFSFIWFSIYTVKILQIGTPEIITIIVLQLEQLDFTVQYCVQKMQTE